MNPDERLNKRIEIAARIAGGMISRTNVSERGDETYIALMSLKVADAIIDMALGDMTVEPK
jgi:hypothetical protein